MRKLLDVGLLIFVVAAAAGRSQTGTDKASPQTSDQGSKATIEGLVRDIACPIENQEATATYLNMKCLRECVKAGSPLAILTKNGELYLPISKRMPDTSQRQRLLPFAGMYVRVTGTVFERKGTHAIAIERIEQVKSVHLKIVDE